MSKYNPPKSCKNYEVCKHLTYLTNFEKLCDCYIKEKEKENARSNKSRKTR